MINITTISTIVGIFAGFGILIAGIGYAWAQYKGGGDRFKDSLIETLKETALAEKTERERLASERTQFILQYQERINQLTKDHAELKGRFEEQVKKAEEYKELLLGRDPKLQETLNEIRSFLKTLIEQSNTNQSRNQGIDKDTKDERGKVMRKK